MSQESEKMCRCANVDVRMCPALQICRYADAWMCGFVDVQMRGCADDLARVFFFSWLLVLDSWLLTLNFLLLISSFYLPGWA